MTPSLFSSLWYRVGPRRLCLAADVCVERQVSRGAAWYLLFNRSGPPLRLNPPAYAFAARLDGQRSVQLVWDLICRLDPEAAPTQDEAIAILWQLHERRLLRPESNADFDAIFDEDSRKVTQAKRRRLNPLALRIGLVDPRRLLDTLEPAVARIVGWQLFTLWSLTVGVGLLLAASHWDILVAHAAKWLVTPYYVLLAILVYPVVKLLHELAHGLTLKHWGCDVPEAGMTFFLLMPIPFVDASQSATLPRWPRAMVSAAGILAELFIAALAIMLWVAAEPGLVRDIAFVVAFTSGLSTVLVNANPLLRFDGYYVLVDVLDLPNLGLRSAHYWRALLRRHLLRLRPVDAPVPGRGEQPWLLAYAPLSCAYRLTLCIALTAWTGRISFLIGTAVGLGFAAMLLHPMVRTLATLLDGTTDPRRRTRATWIGATVLASGLSVVALVPVPFTTMSQGVVWLPEHARLRAETEGFVARVVAADGAQVSTGDLVLVLDNPRIAAEQAQLEARVRALEPELFNASRQTPGLAANIALELEQAKAELARNSERMAGLDLRAGAEGRLVMPRARDLPGSFAQKGSMLGHVLTPDATTVRVAVVESEAALISQRTRSAQVRLASDPAHEYAAEVVLDALGASPELPSPALSTTYGGSVLTDPDDHRGLKPLFPVVLIDVKLPGGAQDRFGERAWVRFDHGAASLAEQWLRRLRQAFLAYFNPAS